MKKRKKKIIVYAVGLGPGKRDLLTLRAERVLKRCSAIAGYKTYLDLFPGLFQGKKQIASGMRQEIQRCRAALDAALAGERVAVVSSGDAGIYGMAGLLLELTEHAPYDAIEIQVIPGITAALAGAALSGAPLMNDFCCISLSDLMTSRQTILLRLRAAAGGDFVTALYNPGSSRRRDLIREAVKIFRETSGANLPVLLLRDIARKDQLVRISDLDHFPFDEVNMTTLVILGNSDTVVRENRFYSRRGYTEKIREVLP